MATITRFPLFSHLKAQPNQHILHFRDGRMVRKGTGLSYWFMPLSAAVAQLPAEDIETTFVLKERSSDFQEVNVQCSVIFRVADPAVAAGRFNFTITLTGGQWVENPLERLASFLAPLAQQPARASLSKVPVVEAIRAGADAIRQAIDSALRGGPELAAAGLELVAVLVTRVAPTAELEKALQTPTREALQQKSDEATFQRRAMAVEKERAIKENELNSQIELARRQEELIKTQSANLLIEVRGQAEAEQARVEAGARDLRTRSQAEADGSRLLATARAEGEAQRVTVWSNAPARVLLGLALQEAAGKVSAIQHLNLSPDLLGTTLQQFLRDEAGK